MKAESNMYVANVSRLANTSSADCMQSGKTAKLNDGDSLHTVSHLKVLMLSKLLKLLASIYAPE